MSREDNWVAVAPEFSDKQKNEIRKAQTAYQFFQKDISAVVKEEIIATHGSFDIAKHGRAVRDRWNALSEEQKEPYVMQQRADASRYAQESHQADVAAIERREQLQQERAMVLLDDEGGTKRTTRHKWSKKQRKKAKKAHAARLKADGEEFDGEDDEESAGSFDSADLSDSSEEKRRKEKKKAPPRQLSQKQVEHKTKVRKEKEEKEAYIASRQQDLRKERASQAKRRLEFLLKQSNIFSHFGQVQEDTAKFGSKPAPKQGSRRDDKADDDEAAEHADETEATFLTQQPSTLGFGKMRDYQLEGLNWMVGLQENGVNGILADEMGLGKTLQSISILVYMLEYKNDTGPHLIVVPKSTLSNWMGELARWAPQINAVKFHGDKATREDIVATILEPGQRDEERSWHVVVTTYEVCNIEKNTLNKFAWCYLIIDEAHRLKNEASSFSKTVRQFETRYRILLTGTPLQNSLHELWALLNFLVPDVFANAEQFDEWFNLDIDDADEKNKLISQLHKILRPFMLRRLKADVEKSLPPKHETILYTGMSAMQKKLYRDILTRDIEAVNGSSGNRTAVLNIAMQLRKCAGHPYLFPGIEDRTLPPLGEHLVENCGKMVLLDKLLRRLQERGHRVLLFTQMTRILDLMEDYLVMRKFKYCRIDGGTSYEDREGYIEDYNSPGSDKFLFLLSTRAGGLGINLQSADVVILYDSDWNPQADLQAQDRAHRIGQKKPVQIFRLVTEHSIEEKIVERAQQKLKLDAMVVQSGRLKDKDSKLSRDELLRAIKFGADKIFKSNDSSITEDDIDMIMDAGKKKTQELNDKLKMADKGDMLDFKLDGGSFQTYDGVDYSMGANKSKTEGMFQLFDIGKRERREANYNENSLFRQQVSISKPPKKKKTPKLPKHLRLPRMEEWHMYDREALMKIQDLEEAAFKALPDEQQKMATAPATAAKDAEGIEGGNEVTPTEHFELPPLITEEQQAEKDRLLAEGFSHWKRADYNLFIKSCAHHGKDAIDKIALDVGKPESVVKEFAESFWGEFGKCRVSEHEYDRVSKLVEKGMKKIEEQRNLERATKIFLSHFDNPWNELKFTHVHTLQGKDTMFNEEEDRYLLCWAAKYGHGQWVAVKQAVGRSLIFRFDYFLRSLPIDALGRRCEQLMKAAEKEVSLLEKELREYAGLPTEPEEEGEALPPIEIPPYREMKKRRHSSAKTKAERERKELLSKVAEYTAQIKAKEAELEAITHGTPLEISSPATTHEREPEPQPSSSDEEEEAKGAPGPDGDFVEFPEYDGKTEPVDWKKPFGQYCARKRKSVKATLSEEEKKDKKKVQSILKDAWNRLDDEEKDIYRAWSSWDRMRYDREKQIFDRSHDVHVPKKRKLSSA